MFNRQPFNRGKFNIPSQSAFSNSGMANLVMGGQATGQMIISASGIANMVMGQVSSATRVIRAESQADFMMDSQANATKVLIGDAGISSIVLDSRASQSLSGEQVIILDGDGGLNLEPGDELIINSCDLTVLVNGQNGMRFFGADSEFFTLLNGDNEIELTTAQAGDLSFDIIWKDRWI